ncbi:MAG TPA: DUF61 family protein [Candidatus Methanomethylophilaceae archaeon]|nr:DUF61 family protein [Candidatus Methanomethylophilaceae archaeon]
MDEDILIRKAFGDANVNIPVSRRTLIEYLESGESMYVTRNGEEFPMDFSEITALAEICTETEKLRLRLPIIVTTDVSGERGAWKVDGKIETSVMSKILNRRPFREDRLHFYNPHLAELRKKFPTTVVLAFIP